MPRKPPADSLEDFRAREELARKNELNDLKNILVDRRVRDFLWRFIAKCKPFAEPMNTNFGIVGHNLGWRAAGMWMWNEITEADFEALLAMQTQNRLNQIEAENAASPVPETDPEQ